MTASKSLFRAAKIFGVLLLVFILAIFIVNLSVFDEELESEIIAGFQPHPMPPPEENAYVALWGFSAAADLDMVETGQRLLARHDEKVQYFGTDHALDDADLEEILQRENLDQGWQAMYESCTSRVEYGCLAKLSTQIEGIKSNARLQLLIERYNDIIKMPYFREPFWDSYNDRLPEYGLLMQVSSLQLAILYADEAPEFLTFLLKGTNFWKRMLADQNSLVAKMVAVASIWKNIQFLSEYILTRHIEEEKERLIKSILLPLTEDERNINEAWIFERYSFMSAKSLTMETISIFDDSKTGIEPRWLINSLIQTNATKNLFYQYLWQPLGRMSELSAPELYELVQVAQASDQGVFENFRPDSNTLVTFSPRSFYNLAGKLAASDINWNAEDYLERIHDLSGVMRLVQLQLEIDFSLSGDIESIIRLSEFTNPYTNRPMRYDADKSRLYFDCRSLGSECGVRIKLIID